MSTRPSWIVGMVDAVFDTHTFVKRLTGTGIPVQQAEVLADVLA